MSDIIIRQGTNSDVSALASVELSAGKRFADIGLLQGEHQALPAWVHQDAVDDDRLWVAANASDEIVGFALAEVLDGGAHLKELDVLVEYGRRGIGRSLIAQVEEWGRGIGSSYLTLTTFETVPWNGPYYLNLGFEVIPSAEMESEIAAVLAREKTYFSAKWPRVAMRRAI